jgi:putative two-component system response regulator
VGIVSRVSLAAIPDAILGKPGKFEPHEWEIMKTHAERWDGGGYPLGLKGEAIPLAARIMNICDQYDALRSKRPYKPAFPHEQALEFMTIGDGRTMPSHFDPAVLTAFKGSVGRFREIFEAHRDED